MAYPQIPSSRSHPIYPSSSHQNSEITPIMSFSVNIFQYKTNLPAIEYASDGTPQNFLIFIGGLGDGLLCTKYIPLIADYFNTQLEGKWAVVETLISSSYIGCGTGSLKRDVRELGQLVKYLRTERGSKDSKVVLMGHSTGCQDTLEYLSKYTFQEDFEEILRLDGGILQAPVSDTEASEYFHNVKEMPKLLEEAKKLIDEGRGEELASEEARKASFGVPVSAYRFYSLNARRTDDDYFSSYLEDDDYKQTFAKIQLPILVLVGEKDEFIPPTVDRQALLEHWKRNTPAKLWSAYSKVVKGADHKGGGPLSEEGAADDIAKTVVKYITETF